MQALYSYFVNEKTLTDICLTKLKTSCNHKNIEEIKETFLKKIKRIDISKNETNIIEKSKYLDICNHYEQEIAIYKNFLFNSLKNQNNKISESFDIVLIILVIWKDIAMLSYQKTKGLYSKELNIKNFASNKILCAISNNPKIKSIKPEIIKKFPKLETNAKIWYKDILKNDKTFINYCSKTENHLSNEDLLIYLSKKIISKQEITNVFFEGLDTMWYLTNDIVCKLTTNMIKNIASKIGDTNHHLSSYISEITIDEKKTIFFENLTKGTIEKWEYIIKKLEKYAENWSMNRIFFLDKLLIVMASYEMLFMGIPKSISMDEYIDLSKQYSTPKSKLFINGVLDTFCKNININEYEKMQQI